ncbi:MAG: neutral zinc metallopeptidase [Chloroflexi bacterium]|nr:neutral zinc metallopeptidase [Chloroflexota bacterium]MDA1239592.1 neutral zinc metallopeptidase [Chloroflexota bacterium]
MPRFNRRARLDTSQVQDRRGASGMALGGLGGGAGLIVIVIMMLLGVNPLENSASPLAQTPTAGNLSACVTGADAETQQDCRIVAFVNSIQEFWSEELPRNGMVYSPGPLVLFTGSTQTACGLGSAQVGPFYCPADQTIYLDLGFFEELRVRFGSSGGDFAEAYVLAHEYGHHVQNLQGLLNAAGRDGETGPDSQAVRLELQADCYSGAWANNATRTGYIVEISDEAIADGLAAAAAVGDDRIQERVEGRVTPENWTHGSAEQRQSAFLTGYRSGDMAVCN